MKLLLGTTRQFATSELVILGLLIFAAAYQLCDTIYYQIRIACRRRILSRLASEGYALQNAVSLGGDDASESAVRAWIEKTTSTLNGYSNDAAVFFDRDNERGLVADLYRVGIRLENLNRIIERPDLYY